MTNNNEVQRCSICGEVVDTIMRRGIESGYHCMRCHHVVRDCYCDDWETESFIYNGVEYVGSSCSYVDCYTCAGEEITINEFYTARDKAKEVFDKYNIERAKYGL